MTLVQKLKSLLLIFKLQFNCLCLLHFVFAYSTSLAEKKSDIIFTFWAERTNASSDLVVRLSMDSLFTRYTTIFDM